MRVGTDECGTADPRRLGSDAVRQADGAVASPCVLLIEGIERGPAAGFSRGDAGSGSGRCPALEIASEPVAFGPASACVRSRSPRRAGCRPAVDEGHRWGGVGHRRRGGCQVGCGGRVWLAGGNRRILRPLAGRDHPPLGREAGDELDQPPRREQPYPKLGRVHRLASSNCGGSVQSRRVGTAVSRPAAGRLMRAISSRMRAGSPDARRTVNLRFCTNAPSRRCDGCHVPGAGSGGHTGVARNDASPRRRRVGRRPLTPQFDASVPEVTVTPTMVASRPVTRRWARAGGGGRRRPRRIGRSPRVRGPHRGVRRP